VCSHWGDPLVLSLVHPLVYPRGSQRVLGIAAEGLLSRQLKALQEEALASRAGEREEGEGEWEGEGGEEGEGDRRRLKGVRRGGP